MKIRLIATDFDFFLPLHKAKTHTVALIIECFSIDFYETKTKFITTAKQYIGNYYREPMRIQMKQMNCLERQKIELYLLQILANSG